MGAIAKGVTSLFGGRARRAEQKDANKTFDAAKQKLGNHEFSNAFAGLDPKLAEAGGYSATDQQVAQLGDAAQATVGQLGSAQGYDSQGYDAAQASAAQAQQTNLGEDTGFSNHFQNLQVNTAQAERQSQDTDQALAAAQEANAHTGGGGATAIAQAALKAKQGVADSIGQQETQNAQLRAQGATTNQQAALAQRNASRQHTQAGNQFNAGLQQQTNLANQSATNQASAFGAGAANDAARFGAQANNTFAQAQFAADNRASEFNAGAANNFATAQFGAQNSAFANNAAAANRAAEFGASAQNNLSSQNVGIQNQFAQNAASGAERLQQAQYGQKTDQFNIEGNRKAAADQARADATGDLVGGIAGVAGAFLSDINLKENIEKVGLSPSGINIYEFNYIGQEGRFEGVMAQEVPDHTIEVGDYLAVDYTGIDVDFKAI